jgi:hypothetical protein
MINNRCPLQTISTASTNNQSLFSLLFSLHGQKNQPTVNFSYDFSGQHKSQSPGIEGPNPIDLGHIGERNRQTFARKKPRHRYLPIPHSWHPGIPINHRTTTIDRYERAGLTALIYIAAGKKMRKGEPPASWPVPWPWDWCGRRPPPRASCPPHRLQTSSTKAPNSAAAEVSFPAIDQSVEAAAGAGLWWGCDAPADSRPLIGRLPISGFDTRFASGSSLRGPPVAPREPAPRVGWWAVGTCRPARARLFGAIGVRVRIRCGRRFVGRCAAWVARKPGQVRVGPASLRSPPRSIFSLVSPCRTAEQVAGAGAGAGLSGSGLV